MITDHNAWATLGRHGGRGGSGSGGGGDADLPSEPQVLPEGHALQFLVSVRPGAAKLLGPEARTELWLESVSLAALCKLPSSFPSS